MISTLEHYLEALLAFVPRKGSSRFCDGYLSLIHVPAEGPERVFTLTFGPRPVLTVARYRETVWDLVEQADLLGAARPQLDALQAAVPEDHPVFDFLGLGTLAECEDLSDGCSGTDYYLMLWQKEGEAGVVEGWEPYARHHQAWMTVIGALQTLAGQYEYAATRG